MLIRTILLAVGVLGFAAGAASAAEMPHSIAFSTNTNGGIAVAANTSMTCSVTAAGCTAALNATATGTGLNNNRFSGVYADIDGDPATFSSSSALLDLPTRSTVLYALLTWGGDSTNAGIGSVLVKGPASGSYAPINAAAIGSRSDNYAAWADVTTLVQAQGAGTYTVANVRGDSGRQDSHAGWQIIVAYRDQAAPPRNLAIFTGFTAVRPGGGDVTITINGFETPATGDVHSSVTTLGFEGDLGITGDQLRLEGVLLSDAASPSANAFNSTIAEGGALATRRLPAPRNNLGIDSDTFDTVNRIANGASDAQLTMSTTNDIYNLATVGVATDLYAPDLKVRKTPTDLNGGLVEPDDVIEYEVAVTNTGLDAAIKVAFDDAIPVNTTYVIGSLQVIQPGGALTALSDPAGDDVGQFDGTSVLVNLGAGASQAAGGTLTAGMTATVRFRVRVDASLVDGGLIRNTAHVTSNGQSLAGSTFEEQSNVVLTVEGKLITLPDLAIELDQDSLTATAGVATPIGVTVTNDGSSAATSSSVNGSFGEPIMQLEIVGINGCTITLTNGSFACPLGNLAVGEVVEFEVQVVVASAGTYTLPMAVSTPLDELLVGNNDGRSTIEMLAGTTALSTTIVPSKRVVRAGRDVRLRATLRNVGSATAGAPELCVRTPPGMSIVRSGGGSLRRGRLCWSWSRLVPGRSATVTYVLRASRVVPDGARRAPASAGNASNASIVTAANSIRIIGGSGREAVTG